MWADVYVGRCTWAYVYVRENIQPIPEYFLEKRHYTAGIVFWKKCIVLAEKRVNPKPAPTSTSSRYCPNIVKMVSFGQSSRKELPHETNKFTFANFFGVGKDVALLGASALVLRRPPRAAVGEGDARQV